MSKFLELIVVEENRHLEVTVNFDQVTGFRPLADRRDGAKCSILLAGEKKPLYVIDAYEDVLKRLLS